MTNRAESSTVNANGLDFTVLSWGSGPLVLAMHGFPDTAASWDVIGPRIAAAGFRFVAPFLRGYHPTGLPTRDTTLRDLADDVLALITALGAERAHLLGHDWGAESVYAATGLEPSRVITLTGIGIPHRGHLRPTPRMMWGLRHLIELSLPGAEGRFAKDDLERIGELIHRWSPTWKLSDAELERIKVCFRTPGVVHAALGYYRAVSSFTPKYLKGPIPVPALFVAGADDPAVRPSDYEGCRSACPRGFDLLTIPGGHFCHRESPEPLIERLLVHLRRIST